MPELRQIVAADCPRMIGGQMHDVCGARSLIYRAWSGRSGLRRPFLGRSGVTVAAGAGCGVQPAMDLAHCRAAALLLMPGKRRRSSIAADSSPSRSKMARISVATASVTTNMMAKMAAAANARQALILAVVAAFIDDIVNRMRCQCRFGEAATA